MTEANAIQRLRALGLIVSLRDAGPAYYRSSYAVYKPASVPGNSRGEDEIWHTEDGIEVDTPCGGLIPEGDKWVFQVREYIPGPGPSDFTLTFSSIDEAVDSIVDYFFGDPSRMNPPDLRRQR